MAETPGLRLQEETSLTVPVAVVEESGAGCPPAQAPRQGAAAATVTIGVLRRILRRADIEGGVAGIHRVALGVHQRLTQEVIGHGGLCWRTGSIIKATLVLETPSL